LLSAKTRRDFQENFSQKLLCLGQKPLYPVFSQCFSLKQTTPRTGRKKPTIRFFSKFAGLRAAALCQDTSPGQGKPAESQQRQGQVDPQGLEPTASFGVLDRVVSLDGARI
jgi:hypothetical protein